jgi:hypothetical protein
VPSGPAGHEPRVKHDKRIITVELREPAGDEGWHWVEVDGPLRGVVDSEFLVGLPDLHECDTLRLQVDVGAREFRVIQTVPRSHKALTERQRRDRVREIRRLERPTTEKRITHLDAAPPPGLRRVIGATVELIDGQSITWRAIDGTESTTSSSPRAGELSAGDRIKVVQQERGGRLEFVDFVAHTLEIRPPTTEKPKLGELALDAMYNLEAGDVVDAWLSFDGIPGVDDAGREGKTRPAIFLAKRGTRVLLRGITDGENSYAKRLGTAAIRDWREAGLKKPSVVMAYDQEVDIADVWVRRGRLTEFDRRHLRIG